MANLKQAMKAAKATGKRQKVTEPTAVDEVKVSVTMRMDSVVLKWAQDQAKLKGLPYQTFLNMALTELMNKGTIDERLSRIEKALFKKIS